MKYLCLIYNDEAAMGKMTKDEGAKFKGDYMSFTADIQKSGHYIGGNPLKPSPTGTTVRVRGGKVSTTDGPYAETKEQLGGYYLVEAKDLNDAIQVAARIPSVHTGAIEVRPVADM